MEKKPFWQELVLQSVAPALALLGVTISVRPDIIGDNPCKKLVTASLDLPSPKSAPVAPSMGGDDMAPPKSAPMDIEPTGSEEMPEILFQQSYEFSIPHFAILIATLILLVQVIRLVRSWKK